MTYKPFLSFPAPMAALALLSFFSGCDDTGETAPRDQGGVRDEGPPIICAPTGTATRYRVTTLHIPTPDDAEANAVVGHNVDGIGDTCGAPDYDGGVDNSLIDLAAALPALVPDDPIDLQAEIDNALNCAADADPAECTRLDLIVSVETGDGCVLVNVLDGDDDVLAGPFGGTLAANGDVRGRVPALALAIPYQGDGGSVSINLEVTNVILTANLSANTLGNIVLGGSLERTAFEATIMDLLVLLGDIPFEDLQDILENLYDVQVGGSCSALSVGLTGSATLVAAP
jgi:hypothetical protein